jgi:hypothetical protein
LGEEDDGVSFFGVGDGLGEDDDGVSFFGGCTAGVDGTGGVFLLGLDGP